MEELLYYSKSLSFDQPVSITFLALPKQGEMMNFSCVSHRKTKLSAMQNQP